MGAGASADEVSSFTTIEPQIIRAMINTCREGKDLLAKFPDSTIRLDLLKACEFPCGSGKDSFGEGARDELAVKPASQFPRKPFLQAVADGDIDTVKILMAEDPGILKRAKDKNGNTATHIAAAHCRLKEFEFLAGLEPELLWAHNDVKNTPAHKAAEAGDVTILKYIYLKDSSLLDCKGALGATPIHMAAKSGHLSVILYLVELDSSALGLRDRRGSTVLHYAATHGRLEVVIWVASRRPALITDQNDQGDTAAHLAAAGGRLDVLRFLLSCNRELLFVENNFGRRPSEVASVEHDCKAMLESMECYSIQADGALDRSSSGWSEKPQENSPSPSNGPPASPFAAAAPVAAAAVDGNASLRTPFNFPG